MIFNYIEENVTDCVTGLNEVLSSLKKSLERIELEREKLLSINIYEIDGFEADDIIGTLAKFAEKNNIEVFIVTGDRDALQ